MERSLVKTLWEKEKMPVTSIFSFSNNVFYPCKTNVTFSAKFNLLSANAFNLDQSKNLSFGKELMTLEKKPFENIVGKRENAGN